MLRRHPILLQKVVDVALAHDAVHFASAHQEPSLSRDDTVRQKGVDPVVAHNFLKINHLSQCCIRDQAEPSGFEAERLPDVLQLRLAAITAQAGFVRLDERVNCNSEFLFGPHLLKRLGSPQVMSTFSASVMALPLRKTL